MSHLNKGALRALLLVGKGHGSAKPQRLAEVVDAHLRRRRGVASHNTPKPSHNLPEFH